MWCDFRKCGKNDDDMFPICTLTEEAVSNYGLNRLVQDLHGTVALKANIEIRDNYTGRFTVWIAWKDREKFWEVTDRLLDFGFKIRLHVKLLCDDFSKEDIPDFDLTIWNPISAELALVKKVTKTLDALSPGNWIPWEWTWYAEYCDPYAWHTPEGKQLTKRMYEKFKEVYDNRFPWIVQKHHLKKDE